MQWFSLTVWRHLAATSTRGLQSDPFWLGLVVEQSTLVWKEIVHGSIGDVY